VGCVVDKVALGQVSSEYFGFPCQFSFHRLPHIHHHLSSWAGTIGQLVADVPSGLRLTPPQETKRKELQKQIVHELINLHAMKIWERMPPRILRTLRPPDTL
jgi:fatty acid desaturase